MTDQPQPATDVTQLLEAAAAGEAARAIAQMPAEDRSRVLTALAPDAAADLIGDIPEAQAAELLDDLAPAEAAAILDHVPSDERAVPLAAAVRPSTAAQRLAAAGGSLTSMVSPASPPGPCAGACSVQDGPAQRHDAAGPAQSTDTIAPGTSLGCRCVPAMPGRSAFQTTRAPRSAIRRRACAMSGTWKMAMYPPSPPRRSRYRPAVVPGRTGATTSTNVSPTANTALVSPNCPTPGSWYGGGQPKAWRNSSAT